MKQLHIRYAPQRHAVIPFLWRVRCLCGWSALAPSEYKADAAIESHISSEEPFPDLGILADDKNKEGEAP